MTQAKIVQAAADVVTELTAALLPYSITPERVYVNYKRMEQITGTVVWVQPVEHRIENITRAKDRNEYDIAIGIFSKVKTDAEIDSLMKMAEDIYLYLRRKEYGDAGHFKTYEMQTVFSPEYLAEMNLFASVMQITIAEFAGS